MWLCIAAFFFLVAGGGLAAGNDAFWVLLDPNTRCTSLSRTQAVVWTAVVLGGYSALTFCNIAFGAGDAASQTTPFSLFPTIDSDLLLLLGVVAGSPVVAAYLSGEAATAGDVKACPQAGVFDRLAQIFQADGPNGPGKLDLSRMQCVFMTLILVFAYVSLLTQVAGNISGQELLAPAGKTPLFTELPPINGSFMVLLAASHTIFQVSKSKWGQQFSPQPSNQGTQLALPQPGQDGQAAGSSARPNLARRLGGGPPRIATSFQWGTPCPKTSSSAPTAPGAGPNAAPMFGKFSTACPARQFRSRRPSSTARPSSVTPRLRQPSTSTASAPGSPPMTRRAARRA
jgi:hypothetical protein